jgi:hypothetical protein
VYLVGQIDLGANQNRGLTGEGLGDGESKIFVLGRLSEQGGALQRRRFHGGIEPSGKKDGFALAPRCYQVLEMLDIGVLPIACYHESPLLKGRLSEQLQKGLQEEFKSLHGVQARQNENVGMLPKSGIMVAEPLRYIGRVQQVVINP